ncbi:MAG: hypothetical protein K0U40_03860 [Betaproteobacteria bacterium]|nr:hypothetical protein [Betaproteobacteria bacterium]
MYKFLSTGLVLIGALLLNVSAMANQNTDNFDANMQNAYTETQTVMSSMDQSATCIVANCRSRLQPTSSQTSASLSTAEISRGLARSITVISSLDQSATCVVANCRSRLQPAPTHPSV